MNVHLPSIPLLASTERTFWLPKAAAAQAKDVDGVFYFIYVLSVIFFVLVVGAMIYFCIRYRRRGPDDRTSPIEGNRRLEIVWSVVPSVLLLVMFLWGFRGWMNLNVPPAGAIDVRVTAQKWSWSFDMPKMGCTGLGELVVPKDTPVRLTMSSRDVIHSFFVPAFRIKRDVVPNRYSVIWFEATELGTYDVLCTEFCGTKHSEMISRVKVVSEQAFNQWVEMGCGMGNLPPMELGKKLFSARGCVACHSVTKDRKNLPGPPLAGVYGSTEQTLQGAVKVDDNYIRESITEPRAKVLKGYAPVMPPYKGLLNDKQINGLIDYIKSLK